MGKRLGEYTKNNTKCMVEVNGEKLIDRFIRQLSKHHLSRLVIVVGYEGQKLIDYIGHRYDDIINIEYITNPIYDKTNNIYSLALASEVMCSEDTILMESDLILEDDMIDMLVNHPSPDLALVAKYESWMDGTMVTIDDDRRIISFVSKQAFNYDEADRYFKTVNVYKFSKEFSKHQYVPFLEAYCKVLGNNEYYEQVLNVLTKLGNTTLRALPVSGVKWYEIDDVQDLDIASTLFAPSETKFQEFRKRYGGFWRFPQLLDFCYLVNPFFPTRRMKDEMKSNYDVLLQNYPSGMYVNSLLAGKCFGVKQSYIVPGNGAAELIKALMEMLPGTLGVTRPTFEEYPNRRDKDNLVTFVPQNQDYRYSADDLINFFGKHHADNLILINPDNPSGNFIPKADILKLAAWCEANEIRLIVDESFVDFSEGYLNNTLLHDHILEAYPHMLVMKSISKSYGVPGIRLGILCSADTDIIGRMKKMVSIWNINSFAEFFMQIFTKYEDEYLKACDKFIAERNDFEQKLREISFLRVMPSQANYFLCEILPPYNANALVLKMLKQYNILTRDCSTKGGFDGKQYMRIAVRSHADNARLIAAYKEIENENK